MPRSSPKCQPTWNISPSHLRKYNGPLFAPTFSGTYRVEGLQNHTRYVRVRSYPRLHSFGTWKGGRAEAQVRCSCLLWSSILSLKALQNREKWTQKQKTMELWRQISSNHIFSNHVKMDMRGPRKLDWVSKVAIVHKEWTEKIFCFCGREKLLWVTLIIMEGKRTLLAFSSAAHNKEMTSPRPR